MTELSDFVSDSIAELWKTN